MWGGFDSGWVGSRTARHGGCGRGCGEWGCALEGGDAPQNLSSQWAGERADAHTSAPYRQPLTSRLPPHLSEGRSWPSQVADHWRS